MTGGENKRARENVEKLDLETETEWTDSEPSGSGTYSRF